MKQEFEIQPQSTRFSPGFIPGTIYEYTGINAEQNTRLVLCTGNIGPEHFAGIDLYFKIGHSPAIPLDGQVSKLYGKEFFKPFVGKLTITQSL